MWIVNHKILLIAHSESVLLINRGRECGVKGKGENKSVKEWGSVPVFDFSWSLLDKSNIGSQVNNPTPPRPAPPVLVTPHISHLTEWGKNSLVWAGPDRFTVISYNQHRQTIMLACWASASWRGGREGAAGVKEKNIVLVYSNLCYCF